MPEQDRKKITELLLRERLGLDEDCLNRDEDGTVHLPSSLPAFLAETRPKHDLKALEADLGRLVEAGCRREALYFCLAQLSPDAEQIRAGRESVFDPGKAGDEGVLRKRNRKLATREDLEAVASKARAARHVVRKYRSELLLAAGLRRCPLPGGMFTELSDPDEALSLLTDSLTWVAGLANSYVAPFEATLLKSKGLLYLTLYVSTYAAKEVRSPQDRTTTGTPASQRGGSLGKREVRPAEKVLASIARLCTGKAWTPSDLLTKLKRFQSDHPALYAKMKAKLTELHRSAVR